MAFFDDPVTFVAALPAFALPLFVFVSSWLEYVFPPYLGDTFVLVAYFLAGQGAASPLELFVATVIGGALGAACAYALGERYGMRLVHRVLSWRRRPLPKRYRLERLDELYGQSRERMLMVNRFLPIIRSISLFAAGAMRLRFWPSVAYATLSQAAFFALMLAIALLGANSWELFVAQARQANLALAAVVAVGIAVGLWALFKRRAAVPGATQ